MTSPSPPASSPTRQSTRSPVTAGTTGMSNNNASTPSKPHHQQHYHHHLPVGHTIHSPAHSATGEVIQGKPSEAGGLHTSTSRGNILVPPPSSQVSSDLLSITSSTTSNPSLASLSRPVSPSAAVMLSTPSSPVIHLRSSSSRPTSPSRSPNINNNNNSNNKDFDTLSNTTTPQLDSSAIFERDAEFATEHLLTGSEAIDLAAAPILSEVALAVTSNDPSPTSSAILGGGVGGGSTASPLQNITQSLDSTLFSSPSHSKLPSNAIIGDNDPHQDGPLSNDSYTGSMPLSERLRQASSSPSAGVGTGIRTSTLSDGTGQEGEFSPQPPSLSLSPSATASPISSTPGSPVQSLNYPHTSSLIGTGNTNTLNTTTALSGVNLGHGSLSDGGAPVMGLEVGDNTTNSALSSPPGSAMSGGGSISLSGNKEPVKRRLSMISYADIINSERLSDSHSGFSSPTPSSALSLSAAALPVHQQQQQSSPGAIGLSPAVSPGLAGIGSATGKISSTTTTTATTGGLGSALYSPVTSPEGEGALSPSVPSDADAKDSTRKNSSLFEEGKDDSTGLLLGNRPPINSRTDTTSSIATERYTMPGQIPLQTPPVTQSNRTEEDEKDVTPTNSKIRKDHQQDEVGDNTDGMMMKESTSGSSWNMIEMGKALVGNAAGAVGSVLGVSGIGTELEDENEINKNQKR